MKQTRFLNAKNKADISLCADLLKGGAIVAFPTETVYGLGGLGLSQASVQKIYEAKNRPKTSPLILHVAKAEEARVLFDFEHSKHTSLFHERFEKLSRLFWPGPLTLVGKKASCVPDLVSSGLPKIGIRIPSHPVARSILEQVREPIAAPSANLYTRPSPTTGDHVLSTLLGRVDAVLDAGPTEYGIESTVLDIDREFPRVLRHGAISATLLKEILPDLTVSAPGQPTNEEASPGQCVKHYAPAVSKILLANETDLARAWFSDSAILLRRSTEKRIEMNLGRRNIGLGPTRSLPDDPRGFAKELFGALYALESLAPNALLLEDVSSFGEEWNSVQDRIMRAQTK